MTLIVPVKAPAIRALGVPILTCRVGRWVKKKKNYVSTLGWADDGYYEDWCWRIHNIWRKLIRDKQYSRKKHVRSSKGESILLNQLKGYTTHRALPSGEKLLASNEKSNWDISNWNFISSRTHNFSTLIQCSNRGRERNGRILGCKSGVKPLFRFHIATCNQPTFTMPSRLRFVSHHKADSCFMCHNSCLLFRTDFRARDVYSLLSYRPYTLLTRSAILQNTHNFQWEFKAPARLPHAFQAAPSPTELSRHLSASTSRTQTYLYRIGE